MQYIIVKYFLKFHFLIFIHKFLLNLLYFFVVVLKYICIFFRRSYDMKKKIFITLFLLLILIANLSFASYNTVTMTVVEEPVCNIELGENSKFEKKLVAKDMNKKEVTIQLQVVNNEKSIKPTGEIMLVIDNSDSMLDEVDNTTREELVVNSAKTLVNNLLKDNDNLKIGVVSFSSNTDVSKEGTIEDASLVSELSLIHIS